MRAALRELRDTDRVRCAPKWHRRRGRGPFDTVRRLPERFLLVIQPDHLCHMPVWHRGYRQRPDHPALRASLATTPQQKLPCACIVRQATSTTTPIGNPCNSTDLLLCPAGSYATAGSTECVDCVAGYADEDSDPSTPCSQCTPGHQQTAAAQTICDPCSEGTADTDSDPATACEICEPGSYAPQTSILCNACPSGEADTDSNPATACFVCAPGGYSDVAATTCDTCQAGSYDDDYDASTPCLVCATGTYTIGELASCAECIAVELMKT